VEGLAQWLCSGVNLHLFLLHGAIADLIESLMVRAFEASYEPTIEGHGVFGAVFLALLYAIDLCQVRIQLFSCKLASFNIIF